MNSISSALRNLAISNSKEEPVRLVFNELDFNGIDFSPGLKKSAKPPQLTETRI
jgi:hypothetical protein